MDRGELMPAFFGCALVWIFGKIAIERVLESGWDGSAVLIASLVAVAVGTFLAIYGFRVLFGHLIRFVQKKSRRS